VNGAEVDSDDTVVLDSISENLLPKVSFFAVFEKSVNFCSV
jgi:hypothetical protein